MTRHARDIAILLALLFITGACSTIYAGNLAYRDGWRRGKIIEIATADRVTRSSLHDCRKQPSANAGKNLFAVVTYFGNRWVSVITTLPGSSSLAVGDAVYVNIEDCSAALIARDQPDTVD